MRFSLKGRIIFIIVSSSLLLILVFTIIQLNSYLDNLTKQNSYQATLSSLIVKNNLEQTLKTTNPTKIQTALQTKIDILKNSNLIQDAVVFNMEGLIVASTAKDKLNSKIRFKDLMNWDNAQKNPERLIPQIDRLRRILTIYVPLTRSRKEPISHIAKITFSLGNIQTAFADMYRTIIIAALFVVLANCLMGYILSKRIIGPIRLLNQVTKIIAQGNLNVRACIKTNDELEELGNTFNYMTEELIKMKERAENVNPLTKLPGNIMIQEQIEKRISAGKTFVVLYADLDNFKAFNDNYGIAKGDEAIKLTAEIMREAIKKFGEPDDFLGHEGGDDFILITKFETHQQVAQYIIKEFDNRIPNLYKTEDRNQGFIIASSRDGTIKKFPIMTISIVGVTNKHRRILSYGEVTNIAAELKKYAKSQPTSIFFLDRRQG